MNAYDGSRFLDIARGLALECVAIQDILATTNGLDDNGHAELKRMLHRIDVDAIDCSR